MGKNNRRSERSTINEGRRMDMNKKWLIMLTGILFSAMLVGCNGDQNPPPPEEDQNQVDEDVNDTNDLNDDTENNNLPGVDEDDNLMKDDEKDTDPDPEDPIEDPEDMQDENNLDQ